MRNSTHGTSRAESFAADMSRAELDAMFTGILNSQPRLDVDSMSAAEVSARLAEIEPAVMSGPNVYESALTIAALHSGDDADVIGAATLFTELWIARAFQACGESAVNLATANTNLATLTETIAAKQIGDAR